ncbi:TPA: hemerythrin family non-heme iron protein [Campylobacter lari]|uniref:hemerythrin domain-containing protein n=1 Tax=Campylobacter sp. W0066.2 TaxID=2735752 RepID=UPI0029877190|nr:hemerythrin family non-heme iron protein [Campylobacter sp. W0066.2]HEG2582113.1 hemerythrin family non-heme iron protein [Campylobacter lari]
MLPEWDQKYSINNAKIDTQHQKLFELAARVEEISDRPIYQVELKKLSLNFSTILKFIFKIKKTIWLRSIILDLNQHKLMYKQITKSMIKLIQSIKSTNDLKEKLYIVVNSWLIEHIIQHDMMIEHWRQSTQAKNSSDTFEEEKPKPKNFYINVNVKEKLIKFLMIFI